MSHKSVRRDPAPHNAANSVLPFVVIIVERRDQHLQRGISVYQRSGNGVDDGLKEWLQAHTLVIWMIQGYTIPCDSVEDGKIEMGIGCSQFKEKVLCPFVSLLDACVAAVNF